MHKTKISPDQVKTQLPVFTGTSSLSVVDATDTWSKALTNARYSQANVGWSHPGSDSEPSTIKHTPIREEGDEV